MVFDTGAGSNQASRKTLEDIRRELETEYPPSTPDAHLSEPDAAEAQVPIPPERPRSASRRRGRIRGHARAAALGCIAGTVLLVVIYVAVTREIPWPGAVASAPEIGDTTTFRAPGATPMAPSNAVRTEAAADRTYTISASPSAEHRGIEPRGEPSATVLPPALAPGVDQQLKALRADLHALAAKLERSESRITGMESWVKGVESTMQRLGDDVALAAVTRPAERTLPAPRQMAGKPEPVAPLPLAPRPVTAADSGRWIPSEDPAPNSSPPPHEVRPLAEAVAPSTRSMPPQPRTESTQSLETTAPTTDDAPSRAVSAPSDNASPSNTPPTLRDKLRDDWRTIKQGFASAGEDFKAAMRDFARKVSGE